MRRQFKVLLTFILTFIAALRVPPKLLNFKFPKTHYFCKGLFPEKVLTSALGRHVLHKFDKEKLCTLPKSFVVLELSKNSTRRGELLPAPPPPPKKKKSVRVNI